MSQCDEAIDVSPRDRALGYGNQAVVSNFVEKYGVADEYAELLFEETKKWLWLCAASKRIPGAPRMEIFAVMGALDEMWHTFILHTRDYEEYCREYLGIFVHHNPTDSAEKASWKERYLSEPTSLAGEVGEKLKQQLDFVGSVLGTETVLMWYGEEEMLSFRRLESERTFATKQAAGEAT